MTNVATADDVGFDKGGGLAPVVVQDMESRDVLMVGYVSPEALSMTLDTGKLHLWSRSRNELWLKGAASGNYLLVQHMLLDCDGDALVALVLPATGATPICHTGANTCFHRTLTHSSAPEPNCNKPPEGHFRVGF